MASLAKIRQPYRKGSGSGLIARALLPQSPRLEGGVLLDRMRRAERENHDLGRAMHEAAQLERKLCGPRHFRTSSYEFASEIFPVRHVSGDFTTVLELEGDLVFAIGDMAGKGLAAGMWFTHVVGMIRRAISAHGDPASQLSAAGLDLLAAGLEFPLTTVFLARFSPATGELTYSNAGHPPPLLIRGTGEVEPLITGGPVLGAFPGASFANGRIRLAPKDAVVAYSDGIAESRDESGIEFGSERLAGVAATFSGFHADAMLFSILAALEAFAGSRDREDDMALAVLRRLQSSQVNSERDGSERDGSEGNGSEPYAV